MKKTLADYGIDIEPGKTRTFCPQCSPTRKKHYDKCLSVDQEKGVWYCHHCGWHGGLGNTEAERKEAVRYFQTPRFVQCDITDQKVLKWFKDRGIGHEALYYFHVQSGQAWMQGPDGGGKTNTIQFPYYLNGKVVNIKYRTGDKRFRQEKNARKCFYNYDNAMKQHSDTLVIVEGEIDALSIYEAGFHAVVSVPDGAPSADAQTFTTKFDFLHGAEELFEKFTWVVLAGDNDAPGKRLIEELARRIGREKCKLVQWPDGCKDANDVLCKRGCDILNACIREAELPPIEGVKNVDDIWNAYLDMLERPLQGGVDIGWPNAIGNFNVELGQMTIVTGIPSHGKSTFIDALRIHLWKLHGYPSVSASPENYPVERHFELLFNMFCNANTRSFDHDERAYYYSKIRNGVYFIQPERDDDMLTIDYILERTKQLVYRYGIKVLVIDPWNEIDHCMEWREREDQYISRQLAKIRRFARVNDIHIFVIAHPTKLVKNKDGDYDPPTAYDIAGGAMWRNKADNILCVYRPDMKTGETEVYIQKIRFRQNGTAGVCMRYVFCVDTCTYYDHGVK